MIKNVIINFFISLFFRRVELKNNSFIYSFIKKYIIDKNVEHKPIVKVYHDYTVVYYCKYLHYIFHLELLNYQKKLNRYLNVYIDNERNMLIKKKLFRSKSLLNFESFINNCKKFNTNVNIIVYGKKGTGKSSIIFSEAINKYSSVYYFTKLPNELKYENESVYIFDFLISKSQIEDIISVPFYKKNVVNIFITEKNYKIKNLFPIKFNRLCYKQILLYFENIFGNFSKSDICIDPSIKYDYNSLHEHIISNNFDVHKCMKNFEKEYEITILSSDEEQNFIL